MKLILLVVLLHQASMTSSLEKTKVKIDLSTDIIMLVMVEKGIRSGIVHAIP